MRLSRKLIFAFLLAMALFSMAMDSQTALSREMADIDASMKQIEQTLSTKTTFSFADPQIVAVQAKMKKLSQEIETDSKAGPSDNLTNVSAGYLVALGELHVLYARMAHIPGVWTSRFDFSTLSPFNLRLHADAARPLILQKPFNARHIDGDEIEFFITSQEKQMTEFLALNTLTDEYAYEKMIQFVSVREGFTNLWALQRLSYNPISTQSVSSCSTDLLSFRVNDGNLKSSEAYLELTALDRYNSLTSKLADAYQQSHDFTLGTSGDYYATLTRLFSRTPEFKAYIDGVPPHQVSAWLKGASDQIVKTEADDWQSDAENAKKVMGASTLIGDTLSAQATANRMAQAMASRHASAASAEIARIATDNLKIPSNPALTEKITAALQPMEKSSSAAFAPKLLPALKDLDSPTDSKKVIYDRIQAKIAETVPAAERLMPAVHDLRTIEMAGAITDDPAEAKASQYTKAPVSYVRDEFQYVITDTATFKTHFMSQLQQSSSLYKKLKANNALMAMLGQYLMALDQSMAEQAQKLESPSLDLLSRLLLNQAQSGARATLASVSDPAARTLLTRAFDTIHLLSAKNPTDLAPTTYAQRDLVTNAIDAGYTQLPILGVNWSSGGFLVGKETLLEHLYDEAWPGGRLPPDKGDHLEGNAQAIIILAVQKASEAHQGKLEDFCQANLHDPKHDQRFRNMFLSATGLRQTLTHTEDADRSAQLKKFDDDLIKQTQTRSEAIMNRFVNPSLNWIMGLTILMIIIMIVFPVTAPVMVTLLAIVNYGMMAPLSAASLYLRISTGFFEQPSQLKYQDALASSQVSAKDPFSEWEQLKKMGLLSNTTDRVSVEKVSKSVTSNQVMTIAMLPMDVWYDASLVQGVNSNTGRAGFQAMRKLFDGDMPAFAEKPKLPKVPSFRSLVQNEGVGPAVKKKLQNISEQTQIVMGIKPVYGLFTSEEAAMGLRTALARSMPEETESLLPEVRLYRDYLKARLKVATSLSQARIEKSSGLVITQLNSPDPIPEFLTENLTSDEAVEQARQFWTDAPELRGHLSISEAMENSKIRKFEMLPRSLYEAASEGRLRDWFKNYGAILKNMNQLRGAFIAEKISRFNVLESKLSELASQAASPDAVLAALSDEELLLMEEAARGPQWLAYGYWSAKLANLKLASSPLKGLLNTFEDYHTMIRSLRPLDWAPPKSTPTNSADQDDMRSYYENDQARDGMLISGKDGQVTQHFSGIQPLVLKGIEDQLYGAK